MHHEKMHRASRLVSQAWIVGWIALRAGEAWAGGVPMSTIAPPNQLDVVVIAPPGTPAGSQLYLTGDSPELCSWNPKCIPLKKIGIATYHATVDLDGAARDVEFKITRGSWEQEAADGRSRPVANFKVQVPCAEPTILSLHHWSDLPPLGVTGQVELYRDFYSPELGNSRTLSVRLPRDYGLHPDQRYPVIYMHDGQNVFDPARSTLGVDWGIDETLPLTGIPDPIVVAIDSNDQDRTAEYTWSRKGALYSKFVTDTVKPFIDRNYRTRSDRDHTFIMGSSFGAMISFSMLWKRPDVFSAAAGLSFPTQGPDQSHEAFKIIAETPPPTLPVRFYMDHGTGGLDGSYAAPANEFAGKLRALGWSEPSFQFTVYPYQQHSEADWAARAAIPLRFLLGG